MEVSGWYHHCNALGEGKHRIYIILIPWSDENRNSWHFNLSTCQICKVAINEHRMQLRTQFQVKLSSRKNEKIQLQTKSNISPGQEDCTWSDSLHACSLLSMSIYPDPGTGNAIMILSIPMMTMIDLQMQGVYLCRWYGTILCDCHSALICGRGSRWTSPLEEHLVGGLDDVRIIWWDNEALQQD